MPKLRHGLKKNDPKSVLRGLKLPVLVFSGRYRETSGFSFAADRHFYLSPFHIHSICVLEWWPNQRNKFICFARTPSMAHHSREARQSKWQNYVTFPRASSVKHPYTPLHRGKTNTYVSTVRTHKSLNHTHPHYCCIHTHAYKHLVYTRTVHMLDQNIIYTECLFVCQNRINCVPHRF